jgi:Holliday junction resolvasome RuvABC endonuclease subunit
VIVGLDLSLTATGVANGRTTWTIDPGALRGPARLDLIARKVRDAAQDARLVAIEGYAFGRPHGMAALGELGGVIRWMLWNLGIPYAEVPPASLKRYATGKGNAPKQDVLAAAIRRGGDLFDGSDDNRADAWWLRAMAMDNYGSPVVTVPAEHRKALAMLRWPALRTVT